MIIKTHAELAKHIEGKKILHLNSLGKDSIVCLEWLATFAKPSHVVSVHFGFVGEHPDDKRYIEYLMKRYQPKVGFVFRHNALEVSDVCSGVYQLPKDVIGWCNKQEFVEFDFKKQIADVKKEYGCDFICSGRSKYESFARASKFHRQGLLIGDEIYPIGMMSKAQVMSVIESTGVKLHPQYKLTPSTYDHPSYWKMRASFIAKPEYKKTMYSLYPLMRLDEYRFERMFNGKKA